MNREELIAKVNELCPHMLSNDNFMNAAERVFCDRFLRRGRMSLTSDELSAWNDFNVRLNTATVGYVVKYLKDNFMPDDNLCYMDCVEGYKNSCAYVTKDQLGDRFFYYVKDLKDRNIKRCNSTKEQEDSIYPYVDDNDVVIC